MKQKQINKLVESLQNQQKTILSSIECDSMTEEQLSYFKEGVKTGFQESIATLKDELEEC